MTITNSPSARTLAITRILRVLAWLLLAGLVFVTIAPIEFRPVTPLPVQVERSAALAVIGFVFALGYPRHIFLVTALVLGSTIVLEMVQVLEPSRHGRIVDATVKLVGGAVGLFAGHAVNRIRHRG